jgi:hypothetical protein
MNAFRSDINEIFQIQSNLTNPNILWEEWKSKMLAVAELHAPPITRKVRSEYAPWITENIKKKAVKLGSRNVHEAYKRARN